MQSPRMGCGPISMRVFLSLICAMTCALAGQHGAIAQRAIAPNQPAQSRSLHLRFDGEQPSPLAMVSGDFDEDGVSDLVIGYGLEDGGSLQLLHGNLDARAPQNHESWLNAGRHEYSDPYVQRLKPIHTTLRPSLMISADVNGDGHLDLVSATKGSSQLSVMFGDGKGNFLAPISTTIAGSITALSSFRPGAPLMGEAVVVGYQSSTAAKISLLSYNAKALVTQATYSLPGVASSMVVANLDADSFPDVAIVAGERLLILHGKSALSGRGSLTTLPIGNVTSVTAGEFLFDRHVQLQLSVLTRYGDVVILAHEGFDPRPYTPQQIAAVRNAQRGHSNAPTPDQVAGNTGNAPWIEVETKSGLASGTSGENPPILLRSRLSGSGNDDLVVVDSSDQRRTLLSHPAISNKTAISPPSRVSTSALSTGKVVAAISAPVSPDARNGLVTLSTDNISPEITLPSSGNTFFVNTTADNTGTTTDPSDGVRCTQGSGERCTLRDAITFVNNDAADNIGSGSSDTIMIPAGTYGLTWQAGTIDGNSNAVTHFEILGPVTLVGDTSGGGVIINGNANDTVFTINPGQFGSFNPSGNSYVFDVTMENLTIENGKNSNNAVNSNLGLANNVGGCINWDAFGTGNLTLTSVTVENCSIQWGDGGGIWAENSAGGGTGTLTINGGAVSDNSTPEQGGGIYNASAPVALSVTGTSFVGNRAKVSVNPSDPGVDGTGGGMYLDGRNPPPATPRSSLTNVTITSNLADDDGGGIATFAGLLIGGSLFNNNSSAVSGGGIWSNTAGDGSQTTITSSNFLSNSATTSGGAIALGLETQAEGNILQVSLSRIFGNTSTNGASGLANGISGDGAGEAIATENWWGCNGGPTAAQCDKAVLYDAAGSMTVAPYAQFGFSSNVTTIPASGSANLTISLNTDSNNNAISGAFPAVATNYPYTFAVTGVTVNPALVSGTFNSSGVGTATLTPTTTGPGTVTATFDNQTDTINFTAQGLTPTSLALTAPGYPYGAVGSSTFEISVTPSNATGLSTANVTATVDGQAVGLTQEPNNVFVVSSGPFNTLTAGAHSFAASFSGTSTYAPNNVSIGFTVAMSSVSISATTQPAKPVKGQGGNIQVAVQTAGAGAAPTGAITYSLDGATPAMAPLVNGVALIPIPTLIHTGSHSVALSYGGDVNYLTNAGTFPFTVVGSSQTTIASLTSTTAQINVFGFGFTPPSGQLSFTDTTSGSPVAALVMLNTATAAPAVLPQVTTSTGVNSLPVWTELADLNGDGILDLVTSVFGTDSVNVQIGNGNGTFGAATSILISAGFGPAEVHPVSLRGNGTMDLIAGSFNTNQVAVLLGNGNGTFQSPTFYTAGSAANTPTSLTTGDFNHDGNLDVAIANTGDNTVSILLGNGSGSLTPLGAPIGVGHDPEAIRAGDFNDDGYSDLAVANFQDGTVTILLNNQNGTFAASTLSVGSGAHSGPQALAISGTGTNLILAVADYADNALSEMQSNGNGTFTAQKIVHVGRGPDDVNITDFNGDGIPDLVATNYTDGTVNLVIGSSGGTLTALAPFPIGNNPYSAAVGDLNQDGTPDLVVSNCFSDNIGVLLSGTQIAVPYSGLSLVPGDILSSTYTADNASQYGSSTSANVTAP
jgi:trimeric autotransporter adhesin